MINFPLIRSKMMKADTDYPRYFNIRKSLSTFANKRYRNDIEAILNK